jgi:hypothetical protein
MEIKKYVIGGKTYYQKKAVIGQVVDIIELFEKADINDIIDPMMLISHLGKKVPDLLSIILIPADDNNNPMPLFEVDRDKHKKELYNIVEPEDAIKIIEDFFLVNDIGKVIKLVGQVVDRIGKQVTKVSKNIGKK